MNDLQSNWLRSINEGKIKKLRQKLAYFLCLIVPIVTSTYKSRGNRIKSNSTIIRNTYIGTSLVCEVGRAASEARIKI